MKLRIKRVLAIFCLVFAFAFTTSNAYSQCAMCRATVESNVGTGSKNPESEVGSGLNTGILYLMVVPYVLIGAVGLLWYKYGRNKNA
ncbi:hypothetical protein ACSX1A_12260 [Pontibacter sp. MBLB2868]|uniref:hypothetical protein n=1 Tax=Pontibacter sp. MBLB2868 TaxID=3451555 RepID=UPI003F750400